MIIQKTPPYNPTFQYHSKLMEAYKNGTLKLAKGFYGGKLTLKNASHEHIIPHSKGGKDRLSNYVLATKQLNQARDTMPFRNFVKVEPLLEYLDAILNSDCVEFDTLQYVKDIIKTMLRALREGK